MLTNKNNGFTLIELIVSMSIVVVILSVVLFNYRSSGDNLSLDSLAQEIGITIRQAQTYGLGVRQTSSGVFTYAYGVHFNPVSNPTSYILFADKNTVNGSYDAGSGSCGSATTECVQIFNMRDGITITGVCSNTTCYSSGTRNANFTFIRPSTDASIRVTGGGITTTPGNGSIIISSPRGGTATIRVENTGQILVQ